MDTIGSFIALGMQDGRVIFFSSTSGKLLLQFQAHASRVSCIHFISEEVLVTGGADGTVRRWDISGDKAEQPQPSRIIDYFFRDAMGKKRVHWSV